MDTSRRSFLKLTATAAIGLVVAPLLDKLKPAAPAFRGVPMAYVPSLESHGRNALVEYMEARRAEVYAHLDRQLDKAEETMFAVPEHVLAPGDVVRVDRLPGLYVVCMVGRYLVKVVRPRPWLEIPSGSVPGGDGITATEIVERERIRQPFQHESGGLMSTPGGLQ